MDPECCDSTRLTHDIISQLHSKILPDAHSITSYLVTDSGMSPVRYAKLARAMKLTMDAPPDRSQQ